MKKLTQEQKEFNKAKKAWLKELSNGLTQESVLQAQIDYYKAYMKYKKSLVPNKQ